MNITTMPKDTLSELLLFLSENEEFSSMSKLMGEGITSEEVRAALRELAVGLRQEAAAEAAKQAYDAKKDSHLSKDAKTIISYLSPGEERALLTAFGLLEKPARE